VVTVNVARVESRVGGTEQFGFWWGLVWHKNDFSGETLPRSEYPFARSAYPGGGTGAQTSLLKSWCRRARGPLCFLPVSGKQTTMKELSKLTDYGADVA
jgi:hypothetical protein